MRNIQQSFATIPMVDLQFGLPTRTVRGNPTIPVECAPDGYPHTFNLDSPESPKATRVCGGEWNWWLVCRTIWGSAFADIPPAIVIESIGNHWRLYLVTGPGGRMVVREVPDPEAQAAARRAFGSRRPRSRRA
ncbi:hypothetical protein [Geodermatophilus ruber]|uniref:Uncharacterized protein n=1 Tax=Geodermatophilus ruber TaxID=504800 RepID=A0A1I4CX87_9ACTN|nr:hypothetical protein [Geodermatophilus ruber]SFK85964.1 hypothetical protein SAMN04488085_10475 [Geodermatophilus ruber]